MLTLHSGSTICGVQGWVIDIGSLGLVWDLRVAGLRCIGMALDMPTTLEVRERQ